jgi:bifunctional DNA-binding transcriptional regulator/antitoxin component of YhaV-PrlF toxin-antitoxin module
LGIHLDKRFAAIQQFSMKKVLPISKRGTITLPPAYRRKIGLDRLENPLILVEEREGKLILEVATALPVRDIPKETIESWIAEDEADGAALRGTT